MKTNNMLLFEGFLSTLNTEKRKEFDSKPIQVQQSWYINYLEDEILEMDAKTTTFEMTAELRRRGHAVAIWGVEDVQTVIENYFKDDERLRNNPLTEEDMKIILKSVNDNQDCNYGITWEHIQEAVSIYISENRFRPYC